MPPRLIALLLAVICAAVVTIWLLTIGGPGELLAFPIVFLIIGLAFRMMGK